jgi:hypothetical protein
MPQEIMTATTQVLAQPCSTVSKLVLSKIIYQIQSNGILSAARNIGKFNVNICDSTFYSSSSKCY